MLDFLRRYGLDKWGPLTMVLFFVVAVAVITVAVLVIVVRPSVVEVVHAAQVLATGAIAIAGAIIGHAHLRGTRELADATREAAAIAAPVPLEPIAGEAKTAGPDPGAATTDLPSDAVELTQAARPGSAVRPDPVEGAHGDEPGHQELPPA